MIRIINCILLCLLIFKSANSLAEEAATLTLDDCYRLALKQSESLQIKDEDIKAAEAKYKEAVSLLYPNIHGLASQRFRDSSSNFSSANIGPSSNSSLGKHPFETSIVVRQPIFSGFRDIYAARASKFEISAQREDKTRLNELFYQDVAAVFNQIIYYGDDLKILGKTDKVLSQRVDELRQFIKLGKSRESEIEAAQSDIAEVGAAHARVSGLLSASKEMLAFLVGREAKSLLLKPEPAQIISDSLESLIIQANTRADIRASENRLVSADNTVKAAERESWPEFFFEGNAYPYQNPDQSREWDVFFRLDVPIYEGGGIDARIEQSKASQRAVDLSLRETKRIAEREVRVAYSDYLTSQAEVVKIKALISASRKNYESQRRDYENGIVTNLDVLAAIRNVQDAERRLIEAQSNLVINAIKVKVAAGGIQ